MKIIIAGSRTIGNINSVIEAIKAIKASNFHLTEVICGNARGVDTIAKVWAAGNGIPVYDFPADWKTYGKAAGPIRNQQMASYADALIAIWDGKSRGTKHMIETAQKKGLKVYIHLI